VSQERARFPELVRQHGNRRRIRALEIKRCGAPRPLWALRPGGGAQVELQGTFPPEVCRFDEVHDGLRFIDKVAR
jgi:hypothetical protein